MMRDQALSSSRSSGPSSSSDRARVRRTVSRHVLLLALTLTVVVVPNVARFLAEVVEGL